VLLSLVRLMASGEAGKHSSSMRQGTGGIGR
jgi:hypothetical protein